MPAIIKPSRIATALAVEPTDGGSILTFSAYLLFDFADNRTFFTDQALWPMVTEQMPKGAVFDKAQLKPVGEWLVAGSALAPDQPVRAMRVSVRVGDRVKRLAVFGDRVWRLSERGLVMTDAVPFQAMPIDDMHGFGGPGFKLNPKGRGHGARAILEGGHDAPLPNVEYADRLIRSPDDVPPIAGLGPMPPDSAMRFRHAGTYDGAWLKTRAPLKPVDFDPLFHCDAPLDQRLDGHFRGDEAFAVSGMTRGAEMVTGSLPNVRVRAFVERAADGSFTETRMVCDTLTLFPNITKATMAFRGVARSEDLAGDDITTIMYALEHAEDAARPAAYYLEVLRLRRDPEKAHLHALSDWQLMPERDPAIRAARRQERLRVAEAERIRFLENQNWAARKAVTDEGVAPDVVPPIDYSAVDYMPLVAVPSREDIDRGEIDLAELMEDVKQLETAIFARRDLEMARAEMYRRSLVASTPRGLLPDVALKPVVDDAHLARFPELKLDDDLFGAFETLAETTTSAGARVTSPDADPAPSDYDGIGAAIDSVVSGFSASRPVDVDKQYRDAVARALDLPEGSLLHEARMQLAAANMTSSPGGSMQPSEDFAEIFRELDAIEIAPGASTAPSAALFPTAEIAADSADGESALAQAGAMVAGRFPHLMQGYEGGNPATALQASMQKFAQAPSLPAGATIGSVLAASRQDAEERLESADRDARDGLRQARRMSPIPIFPMEPLLPEVAARFGRFVAERLVEGADFKGADLAGADLRGVDFRGRDLAGTFFERADLSEANLSGCILEGAVFTGAVLDGADLSGARLRGANLNKASLKVAMLDRAELADTVVIETDLSGLSFRGGVLTSTNFIDCVFDDADLSETKLADIQWLRGRADRFMAERATLARVVVMAMSMTDALFAGSEFERVSFVEIDAPRADFVEAKMKSVAFLGKCNLRGGRFHALRATECGWTAANLDESCFLRADCRSTMFGDCDINLADLRMASFRECRFDKSRMRESDLFAANLFGADLGAADLRLASLRGANLYAANLRGAKLASADLSGANLAGTLLEVIHG